MKSKKIFEIFEENNEKITKKDVIKSLKIINDRNK